MKSWKHWIVIGLCWPVLASARTITLNANEVINDPGLPKAEKVQKLSAIVDQLFTSYGFMYASEVNEMILSIEPQNIKALALSTMLRPLMLLKGSAYRDSVRRAGASPEYQADFKAQWAPYSPQGSVYRFWFDRSKPQFISEADFQDLFRQINREMIRSRLILRRLHLQSFAMTLNWQRSGSEAAKFCSVRKVDIGIYQKTRCFYDLNQKITFDRGDLEFFYLYASALDLMTAMADAYTMNGMIQVTDLKSYSKVPVSDQIMFEYLRNTPQFGLLKTVNQLKRAFEIGPDAITALQFLVGNSGQLCNTADPSTLPPPSHFLKPVDYCGFVSDVDPDNPNDFKWSQILGGLQAMMLGKLYGINLKNLTGKTIYRTKVDPGAIFRQPMTDLKLELPNSFNICGRANGLPDPSLGGLFPNQDANTYLRKRGNFTDICEKN